MGKISLIDAIVCDVLNFCISWIKSQCFIVLNAETLFFYFFLVLLCSVLASLKSALVILAPEAACPSMRRQLLVDCGVDPLAGQSHHALWICCLIWEFNEVLYEDQICSITVWYRSPSAVQGTGVTRSLWKPLIHKMNCTIWWELAEKTWIPWKKTAFLLMAH